MPNHRDRIHTDERVRARSWRAPDPCKHDGARRAMSDRIRDSLARAVAMLLGPCIRSRAAAIVPARFSLPNKRRRA
ncbi:hypothetical protein C8T65DRAFT_671253 [Cerioporus squamosus]|nr:hypothetical protein C8T65DRAFT_671253 [Cerioporus squamosus]